MFEFVSTDEKYPNDKKQLVKFEGENIGHVIEGRAIKPEYSIWWAYCPANMTGPTLAGLAHNREDAALKLLKRMQYEKSQVTH